MNTHNGKAKMPQIKMLIDHQMVVKRVNVMICMID